MIDSQSPEGNVMKSIVNSDHVSPEEAVRSVPRGTAGEQLAAGPSKTDAEMKPGELLFGLFADEPELIQRIARDARDARDREIVKESTEWRIRYQT